MRIVICALAKNEELYINDWIKHHLKIGFNCIYIFDNNECDKPPLETFIDKEYLPKVNIIDMRGIHEDRLQHKLYTQFYDEYRKTFDWCLFCDIDEFLFGVNDIKQLLSSPIHKKSQQIRVKWKLFGDDDLIERDMSKPVYEVFKKQITYSYNRDGKSKGNLEKQGKMIVRGGLNNIVIKSPHFASIIQRDYIIPSCLPSGRPCYSKVAINEDYSHEIIYLHHYMTKSLSEFIKQKLNRTDAVFKDTPIGLSYYWRINTKTPQKIEYLKLNNLI